MPGTTKHYYRHALEYRYTEHCFDAIRPYLGAAGNVYLATPCYYCGLQYHHRDHTYPLIALQVAQDVGELPHPNRLLVVPSCSECNGCLGSKIFPTLQARKAYVKKWLREKYAKTIAIPHWTERELAQLGVTLRSTVIAGLVRQEIVLARLRW